jgi:hypothetical protein
MATREKPKPPAPPKLPTKNDLMRQSDQQTRSQDQADQGDEETGEGTSVEQIRSDLQDAYESIASAWSKLDDLEAEQG